MHLITPASLVLERNEVTISLDSAFFPARAPSCFLILCLSPPPPLHRAVVPVSSFFQIMKCKVYRGESPLLQVRASSRQVALAGYLAQTTALHNDYYFLPDVALTARVESVSFPHFKLTARGVSPRARSRCN